MGREYTIRTKCSHEGCNERSLYSYTSMRDYNDAQKRKVGEGWRCVRHTGDDLLSPEVLSKSKTHLVGKSKRFPELEELFFNDRSGFAHGTSWKAYANDFPEGTQIIESVEVILPNETKSVDPVNDLESKLAKAIQCIEFYEGKETGYDNAYDTLVALGLRKPL